MNNYQAAAAAAAQGFGPPASPHAAAAAAAANSRGGFPPANSPGPIDMYSSSAADSVAGYVQAASPQPSGFPTIAVSMWSPGYRAVSALNGLRAERPGPDLEQNQRYFPLHWPVDHPNPVITRDFPR